MTDDDCTTNNLPNKDKFIQQVGFRSENTGSTYRAALTSFETFCEGEGLPPLETDSALAYYKALRAGEYATSTVVTYVQAVLSYAAYLSKAGVPHSINIALVNEAAAASRLNVRSYERVEELHDLRMGQMPLLVAYFQDQQQIPEENDPYGRRLSALRDRALFWALHDSAARIGEIARLDRKHYDKLRRGEPVKVSGKGWRPHYVRFLDMATRATGAYLRERRDTSDALFVAHSRNADGKRASTTTIHKAIKEAMRLVGMDGRLRPHDIRHYRATKLLEEGVPLHVIQEYLNHQDLKTTRDFYAPITGENVVSDWLKGVDYP